MTNIKTLNLTMTLWLLLAILVGGCAGENGHGHAHGEEGGHDDHAGGHDDHAGGHDDHGGGSEVVTTWGGSTQLFVEFPTLVLGQQSRFAAHLTRLRDHLAISEGRVVVELSGGGHPVERFAIDGPSVAGIFRPIVQPRYAGQRNIALSLTSAEATELHYMGEFTVFQTAAAAAEGASAAEDPEGAISFLLEQQWRIPFRIERAESREMRPSVPAFGRFTLPNDSQSVVTAPRDGRVDSTDGRFPQVGDGADDGAPLVSIRLAPRAESDQAGVDLAYEQSSIRVEAAQVEVDRIATLVEQGIVARSRLDAARATLADAEAERRSARRQRASLRASQEVEGRAESLDVPSPIAGVISEMYVSPGTWVEAGDPIARVVNRDYLWLDVQVSQAYLGQLRDVSGVWYRLSDFPTVFELPRSALVSVGVEVDPETRTLPIRFRVDNTSQELFAGMSVRAHLMVGEPRTAVAISRAALIDDAGIDVVYAQTGGETFVRRPVRLGVRDGDHIEVTTGIDAGQWVATLGAYSVKLASTSAESVGHGHAH